MKVRTDLVSGNDGSIRVERIVTGTRVNLLNVRVYSTESIGVEAGRFSGILGELNGPGQESSDSVCGKDNLNNAYQLFVNVKRTLISFAWAASIMTSRRDSPP